MMDFGQALRALKEGKRVARKGWNGRGMYLWLKPQAVVKKEWCKDKRLIECINNNGGEEILALGTICMYTHDSTGRKAILTGWLASQSDMLSEDWFMLPDEKEEEPKQEPREAKENDKEDKLAEEIKAIIRSIVEEDDTDIEVRVIHVHN